jgi:hypothetical protein
VTKQAHITSRPNHAIGDKVLGLCGKEFKVKVLWADLPKEKPICRECVDTALDALTECEHVITIARRRTEMAMLRMNMVNNVLNPEDDMILDIIADNDAAMVQELEQQKREKDAEDLAKVTCTCTWTSPEIFTEDPNCPIHGGEEPPPEIEEGAIGIEDVELPPDPTPGSVQRNGDAE